MYGTKNEMYGTINKTYQMDLNRVQYTGLWKSWGAIRSTPINSLLAEAGEFPLEIWRKMLADRYLIKKISTDQDLFIQLEIIAKYHVSSAYWRKKYAPPLLTGFYYIQLFLVLVSNMRENTIFFSKKYIGAQEFLQISNNFHNSTNLINLEF